MEKIVALTQNSLRENFNADEVHILLVADKPARAASRKGSAKDKEKAKSEKAAATRVAAAQRRKLNAVEGLKVVPHTDKSIELFAELFESGQTSCGMPNADQLACFVGKEYSNIASAALIPLFHERQLGVVMLTSKDESRFSSGKGVMFLNQLGELLGRRLHTYGAFAPAKTK